METPSRFGLQLVVHVQADKRQELLQSLKSLAPQDSVVTHTLLLQGLDDANLICLLVKYHDARALDAYLQSRRFRALRGAIAVLGCLQDLQVVEGHEVAMD